MPYSFNPFSGNFDNTPSTLKGNEAYSTLQSASGDWSTYDYVDSTFLPLTGGTLSGNLAIGGGPATLFVGSSSVGINTETPNEALTVVGNVSATGTVVGSNLNASSWDSVYSTVQSKSATEWDNTLANQYAHTNFFPLTGGIVAGATRFNNDVTIFGNLSCSGTQTFANTVFTTTSAVSVVHFGSGPALWVGNNGNGDIASFYDMDQNVEVLHVGGNNGDFPNVGVKTSTPNKDFTVNGELSASNIIWAKDNNSDQWTSAYSTVQANSSVNWNYQGTDLKQLSANWQSTYTTVESNSSKWESVYSTVNSNSAVNWNYQGTDLKALSADWQSTFNTVQSNSATNWNYQGTDLKALSANWESTYTTVQTNSSTNWNYQGTDLKQLSANWQSTYTTVQSYSATNWNNSVANQYAHTNFLPLSGGTITSNLSVLSALEVGSGTLAFVVTEQGNVGIKTEQPNHALTVIGSISATDKIYTNSLVLSNVEFTNTYTTNVSSITASNDFIKVIIGGNTRYLRLFDVQ